MRHLFPIGLIFVLALPLAAETIPAGTEVTIRLDKQVEPRSKDQDEFTASVDLPVFAGGREVVPAGTRIRGDVRGSSKEIFLSPKTLVLPDGRQVDFNATVSAINNKKLKQEGKEGAIESSGGGAGPAARQAGEIGVTGAEIGAMSTGSAAGAGMGAAAGVAAVIIGRKIAGHHKTTVIPAGTQLTLSLNQALEVPDNAMTAPASDDEKHGFDEKDGKPTLRREDAENNLAG